MYTKFNRIEVRPIDVPNAEESKSFWGDIQKRVVIYVGKKIRLEDA